MVFFEMNVMNFGLSSGMTTLLTNIHLRPALFVSVTMLHSMHFQTMRFQAASLGERFLAHVALVGSYTWTKDT